jgi:hypothetical protein
MAASLQTHDDAGKYAHALHVQLLVAADTTVLWFKTSSDMRFR